MEEVQKVVHSLCFLYMLCWSRESYSSWSRLRSGLKKNINSKFQLRLHNTYALTSLKTGPVGTFRLNSSATRVLSLTLNPLSAYMEDCSILKEVRFGIIDYMINTHYRYTNPANPVRNFCKQKVYGPSLYCFELHVLRRLEFTSQE